VKSIFKSSKFRKSDFKQLFDEYFEQIKSYIYYKSGDEDLASDISQEVFLKIWEIRENVKKETVISLLYSMANNLFISYCRHNKIVLNFQQKSSCQQDNSSPEQIFYYQETKNIYEKALSNMNEEYRTVFLMSRMEELKYREIAERLDISIKTVEKRMSRALSYLKQELTPFL
jgi:RNA polymerase sigma-70 factor (ECF subfamily)